MKNLILILLSLTPIIIHAQDLKTSPCLYARIVLMTDVSGSMRGSEAKVIQAHRFYIDELPIEKDKIKVALSYFDSDMDWFNFSDSRDSLKMNLFFHDIRGFGGGTNLYSPLNHARELFLLENKNIGVPYEKIIILFTDGQIDEWTNETVGLAKKMRAEDGITIYAIHIDSELSNWVSVLKSISGESNYRSTRYRDITDQIKSLGPCM